VTSEVLILTGFCEITTKGSLENHQATHRHAMATGVERMHTGRQTLVYNQKSGHFIKGIALNYSELVGFPYISPGKDLRSGSFNLDWFLRNHHQGVFGKSRHHPQTCYGHGGGTDGYRTSNTSIRPKIRPFHEGDCFELFRISWFPIYKPREGSALWKF